MAARCTCLKPAEGAKSQPGCRGDPEAIVSPVWKGQLSLSCSVGGSELFLCSCVTVLRTLTCAVYAETACAPCAYVSIHNFVHFFFLFLGMGLNKGQISEAYGFVPYCCGQSTWFTNKTSGLSGK